MIPTSPPRCGSQPHALNAASSSGFVSSTVYGWHTYAVAVLLCLWLKPHQHNTSGPTPAAALPQRAAHAIELTLSLIEIGADAQRDIGIGHDQLTPSYAA